MSNDDVKMVYDAFIALCNHIEYSNNSCSVCHLREKVCFNGNKGTEFWETMSKIEKELDTK